MLAKEYGPTQAELTETIVHLAFHAGAPRTLTAIDIVKQVFGE